MKQIFVRSALALAVLLGGSVAYAQMGQGGGYGQGGYGGGQHQPMSGDQRLDMLTKQLNLTSDQQQQIKPILTPDQQTKWQQMMERHGRHGMGPGATPPGTPPNPRQ